MGSRVFLVAAVLAMAVAAAGADVAADRAECSDKLVALATCLTFVQGQGQAPTPDCCGGLKTVLQTSPKCLCVLVKDRDDPGLDLKLNVTRALGLPAACSAPANISDCPSTSSTLKAQALRTATMKESGTICIIVSYGKRSSNRVHAHTE
uniref:Bifunctional inhibitor/plant lipid transfer protein/seed storage helical domain-containing protein n=1 Tax=Aegilops tauschii subsp. strangulata TaxID=200361 RepID=A0A453PAD8_AEGTS